ncbi:response regulator [Phyllobacterium sp. 2063]|nr:response regulator [Phyllobacterium sp. 2063]
MFEQAPGFMAMMSGPEHICAMANAAYLQLIGHRDILGRPLNVSLPEIADQGFVKLLDEVYETGRPFVGQGMSVELQVRPGGKRETRYVDFVYQPIFDEAGKTSGIFVQGHDVTEQKQADIALRKETRLLQILNHIGADIAGELDLEKVVQMVTDACLEMVGAQFGAFFYNVLDEKGESYMLYSLSGVPREEFSKFPMPRNTAVFAPTFAGEGVVRSDDILQDPRYGKSKPHYGMPKGHLPVRSYLAVPVSSRSGEVIGGLFFGHAEVGMFKPDHETLLVGIAGQAAVAIDNARLFQAAERELAERRQAEQALHLLNMTLEQRVADEINERSKAEEQLRQAQKMEALGQLTGGVAHDFNNLLQIVSGNLQLMAKDVAGNPRAERRVENALAGVSRGSKLASQLLAFGRRQALEPKVVNIGRFVANMGDMLRRTIGESVEMEFIGAGGLWNTLVDPTQIENAVLNLAINARDAMDDSGKLTIEVGNAFLDDAYARKHVDVEAGQYVMLAVTDTGVGMSSEVLAQVFEPFFSTKPVGKGTGLGLSMVYGFVRQSGGHVKIYSEPGQGTTVKIYLPRVHHNEDILTDADFGPVTGGTETVLVAEDDEEVRATVVEMLGDLGYRVLKAKDATSALSIIESGVPIDLLFTDVVMPGPLRSPELARQARQRLPNIAVLFTSGYTENAIVHGGRLDAGVELLSKPYGREALARKIRNVLDSQIQRDQQSEQALASAPEFNEAPLSPALTILLVEDDVLIRMNAADMLTEMGHTVVEASNSVEAMNALRAQPFDILFTDITLPGASGSDLASEAQDLQPDIGIIFATGRDALPKMREGIRSVLLRKPYGSGDIVAALSAARNGN